jgi:hypothetical protein
MKWLGYVARRGKINAYEILVENPEGKSAWKENMPI